ncbi:hypothetical protein PSCICL_07560 [Pseudomonas cichorii]|nr:hypothetical protein PSCICL_07560 [Pseudomonas cichorii]
MVGRKIATNRLLLLASPPASMFDTYPVLRTASSTFSRASLLTTSGRCKARETVIGETPATFATSISVRLDAFLDSDESAASDDLPAFFAMMVPGLER